MFQVTRKADYAIRLMLDLAARPGDLVSTAEIARRQSDGTWLWVIDQFSIG